MLRKLCMNFQRCVSIYNYNILEVAEHCSYAGQANQSDDIQRRLKEKHRSLPKNLAVKIHFELRINTHKITSGYQIHSSLPTYNQLL